DKTFCFPLFFEKYIIALHLHLKSTIAEQGELLSQKDHKIDAQNKEIEELKRRLAQFQTGTI
ncbi:MAG TPA: hypothetical protein H9780_04570, partial [Candidatus Mediterraneibacter merdavium]|nr:hypothetical protein [Candidatus Mediterraneibacter merdavium]